jgi:hypothetical protein
MKKMLLTMFALTMIAGVTYAANSARTTDFKFSATRVEAQGDSGNMTAYEATIPLQAGGSISAKSARFTVDNGQVRSVALPDGSSYEVGGVTSKVSGDAVFFPDLQIIKAKKIFTLDGPTYSCSAGTLYINGTSSGGGSTCVNNRRGAGSNTYSCGGSGGNTVQVMLSPYSCMSA